MHCFTVPSLLHMSSGDHTKESSERQEYKHPLSTKPLRALLHEFTGHLVIRAGRKGARRFLPATMDCRHKHRAVATAASTDVAMATFAVYTAACLNLHDVSTFAVARFSSSSF